ncbi:MAG: permease-like cell division protein FtsX [Lachnospiraceae bacterium]|nr:permease-like cell division protein FtsX [Lachnospiraceae bacterium]
MLSYVFKTGFRNLGNKKLFTFASIGTIASSVLIFCIFFALATNIKGLINKVETIVGIQVFFDNGLTEDEIKNIANEKFMTEDVKSIKFISSNEAWESFKKDYFDDKAELAEAFEDDNPLANSASYEILLNDITKQYNYVNYLKSIEGVRQINYSNVLIDALTKINIGISTFSIILIVLLLVIAMILISNTISLSSQFRKKENEIMRLIGATKFMIRAPFVIEGFFIGLFGSLIPVIIVSLSYNYIMKIVVERASFLSNIFTPVNLIIIAVPMAIIAVSVSSVACIFVSFFTIRKHLKV